MKQKIMLWCIIGGSLLFGCDKNEETTIVEEKEEEFIFQEVEGSKWISEILSYQPAPGQFVNTSTANKDSVVNLVGGKTVVSLGGYGGSIVFRFDHAVQNRPGTDFVILGNAFKDRFYGATYPGASNSEAGIVMVSVDENKNGLADDKWYELQGANDQDTIDGIWYEDYTPIQGIELKNRENTIHNYEITYYKPKQLEDAEPIRWTDNQGQSGEVKVNDYHKQTYYPCFGYGDNVPESITCKGTRLPSRTLNLGASLNNGQYYVHFAFGNGYVDNYSEDYQLETNGDPDTRGGNKFNLDCAVDENRKPVKLNKIDFIKVYTGVLADGGWTGEVSTEIRGAISLSVSSKK